MALPDVINPTKAADASVQCRIRKLKCISKTVLAGDDHMVVAGATINDRGMVFKVSEFSVGTFKDNGQVNTMYPPRWFDDFNLNTGLQKPLWESSWPKGYIATIVLCEKNSWGGGGFDEAIDQLLNSVQSWVKDELQQLAPELKKLASGALDALEPGLGTATSPALGPLVDALISVVDFLIKFFFDQIIAPIFDDRVFLPITTQYKIPAYSYAAGASTSELYWYYLEISGILGGKYEIEWDWQVNWPGYFADKIDTAVTWPNGKIYFFSGSKYVRYDMEEYQVDQAPLSIADYWKGLWSEGIDAGVVWPNGKAYFFKGDEYIRYDIAADKADAGYPKKIADGWKGVPNGIDAAVVWPPTPKNFPPTKAYFFEGNQYFRYDMGKDAVDPGYPKPIKGNWLGVWSDGVKACIVYGSDESGPHAYFFKGAQYVRYKIFADEADSSPRDTGRYWPGL